MGALAKALVHHPLRPMEENQKKVMFEDYVAELGIYPAFAIHDACRDYRMNHPDNTFFPSIGWLANRAKEIIYSHRRKQIAITTLLNSEPEKQTKRMTVEQMEAIKSRLVQSFNVPKNDKIQATIDHMKASGASQADIDEFVNSMKN